MVVCLGVSGANGQAQPQPLTTYSGRWLHFGYQSYKQGWDSKEALAYEAYVAGAVDMVLVAQRYGMKERLICPPLSNPMAQYLHAVGEHMEDHPELHNEHRAFLVLTALQEKYGC